jgi:hypothetical protein
MTKQGKRSHTLIPSHSECYDAFAPGNLVALQNLVPTRNYAKVYNRLRVYAPSLA